MYQMLIDGELISTNAVHEVINPVDETVAATVPVADVALMDRAIAAAKRAWPAWRDTPIEARGADSR